MMGLLENGFGPLAVADRRKLVRMPRAGRSSKRPPSRSSSSPPTTDCTTSPGCGPASRCWCTRRPAGWARPRCSSLATGARRCSAPRVPASGRRCAPLGWPRTISPPLATLGFRDRFRATTGGRGVDVVLDSLAGEFVDASSTCCRAVAGSWRWARPTSGGDGGRRHPPGRRLPGVRPGRSGTGA
ncbi:hypothetical protein LV779_19010 [Streptomyces thinghirensis]|nr:hypothetical protein [Streptomyces thinghirensis]